MERKIVICIAATALMMCMIAVGNAMDYVQAQQIHQHATYETCFICKADFCDTHESFCEHLQCLRSAPLPITCLDVRNSAITDQQLNHMLNICGQTLKILHIAGCRNLQSFDIAALLPNLVILNAYQTNITCQQRDMLIAELPKILMIMIGRR